MVGLTGFEPAASSSRTRRATKLRHSPIAAPAPIQIWTLGHPGGDKHRRAYPSGSASPNHGWRGGTPVPAVSWSTVPSLRNVAGAPAVTVSLDERWPSHRSAVENGGQLTARRALRQPVPV